MMTVTTIWRYPIKSMAGERLPSTELTLSGVVGDRVVQSQPSINEVRVGSIDQLDAGCLLATGHLGTADRLGC